MKEHLQKFVVNSTDTIQAAMLKITANHYRVVVVLDENKVVGTVSDGDIRRAFIKEVLPIAPVETIMNINCKTTIETDSNKLRDIIQGEKVTLLPIVDSNNEFLDVFLAYEPFDKKEAPPE